MVAEGMGIFALSADWTLVGMSILHLSLTKPSDVDGWVSWLKVGTSHCLYHSQHK